MLATALIPAYAHGADQADSADSTKRYEGTLHVIVFESMNIHDRLPKDQVRIVPLPTADLPLRVSRPYFSLSSSSRFSTSELGLRGDVSLVEINTFALSEKQITESKQVSRHNPVVGLTYSLKVLNWQDNSCSIRFSAKYRDKHPPLIVELSRHTTTLLRIDRVCFAFTFINAAIAADDTLRRARMPDPKLKDAAPRPITNPLPEYPRELRSRRVEGNFLFMAVITRQGTIDPSHGIILDCYHWSFARNAMEVLLNDWLFVPSKENNQAEDMLAIIEVAYRLR